VPSAVGSAVYRILQESVTNVLRHVGPTRVCLAVTYGTDTVEVRVTDEGPRQRPAAGQGPDQQCGRGIAGMRERCRLLGGNLDAGPRAGGGFAVTARLPLTPAGTAGP
jgi:signal transduction histidine kinase